MQKFFAEPGIALLALGNGQILKIDKNLRKPQKNCRLFQKKMVKFETLKC